MYIGIDITYYNNNSNSYVNTCTVIRLENIVMCKIAHLCTVLCAILTTSVRDFYLLMN